MKNKILNFFRNKLALKFNYNFENEYKNALIQALDYSSTSTIWDDQGVKSGGWFHNVEIFEGAQSFNIFGSRPSVSIASPNPAFYPMELYEYVFQIIKGEPYGVRLENLNIIEFGSAEGYGALALSQKNTVTAVDLSKQHIYRLALILMYKKLTESCTLVHQDMLGFLEKNTKKYDLVICLGVLYHLSDIETGIAGYLVNSLNQLFKISKLFVFEIYYFEDENLDNLFTKRSKIIPVERDGNKAYLNGGFALNKRWLENYFDLNNISWKCYPRKNPADNFANSVEYIDHRIIYVCTV